jgi:hypothetical protein
MMTTNTTTTTTTTNAEAMRVKFEFFAARSLAPVSSTTV